MAKKLADMKLEEEETVVGSSTTINGGDEPQELQVDIGIDTVDQFPLLSPNGSSKEFPLLSPNGSSKEFPLLSPNGSSKEFPLLAPNGSSKGDQICRYDHILTGTDSSHATGSTSVTSSHTSDSSLSRVPNEDPIRRLFQECEEEANRPDSDEWNWNEGEALESMNQDVEYWFDENELPSISDIDFEDLRNETEFSDELARKLIDEISSFERISFDAFGERIERRFPVEYVAICGQIVTEDGMYYLKIFLLPLQSTEKITPVTKQVINILKTIFSGTAKLVHMCVFLSEVLNKRYGIDIRMPIKSLTDTSILDAYHRQNTFLRKAPINGQVRVREEIKIRPLEECLTHYLDLDLTAEFFPDCGKDDEYLCLKSNGIDGGLTNTAKNFLVRKIALLFPLEDALHDQMFGIIDNGIINIASKMLCEDKQACDLRLRYLNKGIKAGEVLQIEDTIAANLEVLIGIRDFSMIRHRNDGILVNQHAGCPSNGLSSKALPDPVSNRMTNGQSPASNGTEAFLPFLPTPTKSRPRQRIQLGNNVKSIGSFPSNPITDTSPNTDDNEPKSSLESHSTLHHVLNRLHREKREEKGVIDWGTVSYLI